MDPSSEVERERALRDHDEAAWLTHPEWWNIPGELSMATLDGNGKVGEPQVVSPGYPDLKGIVCAVQNRHDRIRTGVVINLPIVPQFTVYDGNLFSMEFVEKLRRLVDLARAERPTDAVSLLKHESYASAEELVADWCVD